jgi:hypothetical protein
VTDEQQSGRPKDRPLPISSFSWLLCIIFVLSPRFHAAAGIYELASKYRAVLIPGGQPEHIPQLVPNGIPPLQTNLSTFDHEFG